MLTLMMSRTDYSWLAQNCLTHSLQKKNLEIDAHVEIEFAYSKKILQNLELTITIR